MQMQKHTLNLREGDFEQLELFYGPKGISTSLVIRTLVSRVVDNLKNAMAQDDGDPLVDIGEIDFD